MGNKNFRTLLELTGQESGIVMRGASVIATNWFFLCPQGGLPVLAPAGTDLIVQPAEILLERYYEVADVREAIPGSVVVDGSEVHVAGMDILSDKYGDIYALYGYDLGLGSFIYRGSDGQIIPTPGTVYELTDGTLIIAPEGWA